MFYFFFSRQASPSEEEINKNAMNTVSGNQVANAGANNVVVIDGLHGGALHPGQLMNHNHHGMSMHLHQQFQMQTDPQQMDLNSYHASNAQQQQGAIDSQGNVITQFDLQVCSDL